MSTRQTTDGTRFVSNRIGPDDEGYAAVVDKRFNKRFRASPDLLVSWSAGACHLYRAETVFSASCKALIASRSWSSRRYGAGPRRSISPLASA